MVAPSRKTPGRVLLAACLVAAVLLAGCADFVLPGGSSSSCTLGIQARGDRPIYAPEDDGVATITNTGTCVLEGVLAVTLKANDGVKREAFREEVTLDVGGSLTFPFAMPSDSAVPEGESHVELHAVLTARFNRERLDVPATAFLRIQNFKAPELASRIEDPAGRFILHYDPVATRDSYAREVARGVTDAWNYFAGKGFREPLEKVHVYIENPRKDKELGTLSVERWGLRLVLAPEDMFRTQGDDPHGQTPAVVAAHEVFHAFQTRYDLYELWLIEGMAAWAQDKVHGTKTVYGHGIEFLNNPDKRPGQYLEYQLGLFLVHLEEKHGEDAVWRLLGVSAEYDNAHVFHAAFGQPYEELWAGYVRAIAEQDFRDRELVFRPPVKEDNVIRTFRGLLNFTWHLGEGPRTLAADVQAGHVRDPASNERPDAGRIHHAFGIQAIRLEPAGTDPIRVTFTRGDEDTRFHAYLAVQRAGQRTATLLTPGEGLSLDPEGAEEILLVVTRGDAGTGRFGVTVAPV